MSEQPLRFRRVVSDPFHHRPVRSYGLIVHSDQGKILLVRRRYTVPFVNLVKGTYRVSSLESLVKGLSRSEASSFLDLLEGERDFTSYFLEIFSPWFEDCQSMLAHAYLRFQSAGPYLLFYFRRLNIETLSPTPEWLFPKGKQRFKEGAEDCARRECREESGIDVGTVELHPVKGKEVTVSERGRTYETLYFSCCIPHILLGKCEDMEIGDKRWASQEECQSLLSPRKYELLL